jgi:hypothetical protein
MKFPAQDCSPQVESISPRRIFLDARGVYPRELFYRTKQGETKVYRIIQTKSDCLTLNK